LRQAGARGVRWVSAGNIHITLKFLGDISPGQIPGINQAIQSAVCGKDKFLLRLKGIGAYPNTRRPRVVWVGVEPEPSLFNLAEDVENGLKSLGFPPEGRPFSAHITLGRVSQNARPEEVAEVARALEMVKVGHLAKVDVEKVVLFRSELTPHGSIYSPISHFLLGTFSQAEPPAL